MKEMLDKHRRDGLSFGREVLVANLAALITLLGDDAIEVAQNDAQLLVQLVTKAMDDLA